MPIPFLLKLASDGLDSVPWVRPMLKLTPWLVLLAVLKLYFNGVKNRSERLMHSKVIMITGGTSGVGACIARDLALRGAQIVLLTHYPPDDPFLVDYIDDLRTSTGNGLVYAEQVDLTSLHNIRVFATKWIDNAPPRRLDMIILCASTQTPARGERHLTPDGLNEEWMVNYLANFHLLSILSPALRIQPPDRDVRIIFATCSSYINATLDLRTTNLRVRGSRGFARSKLALMIFADAFQKHLNAYKRPDGSPMNARVILADPGWCRTPGMRRWLTGGTVWGLLLYILTYPLWWLILKSPSQGAQSFLKATMEADYERGPGGRFVKECRDIDFLRREIKDETIQKKLWKFSEKQIEKLEKADAVRRALAKEEEKESQKKAQKAEAKKQEKSENEKEKESTQKTKKNKK